MLVTKKFIFQFFFIRYRWGFSSLTPMLFIKFHFFGYKWDQKYVNWIHYSWSNLESIIWFCCESVTNHEHSLLSLFFPLKTSFSANSSLSRLFSRTNFFEMWWYVTISTYLFSFTNDRINSCITCSCTLH